MLYKINIIKSPIKKSIIKIPYKKVFIKKCVLKSIIKTELKKNYWSNYHMMHTSGMELKMIWSMEQLLMKTTLSIGTNLMTFILLLTLLNFF